ncbi:2-amino-4-hydroxy-6-hydroxymethyldihydropteridine diphosphokinase [Psychromarinibacter sp. C21-152]|uniref:2-amino-4-hydroxy-6-hydroxymethyldihydropteridine pyrophosphokinase n=1 Tax=Psychromarinibacter sediminicola TaxID=3033385 RepID=A0AAE3NK36_9RHOB|nr:2-amino-4-hydroxy-6-hydroxymethyldihydropteridine diphosphokinase [Psychromarinibacter sediminicola]MDF0599313.1 2-amino-4-hydroxy-6-hydroxymethyldihydropteridine diphosphokinase [Psychromarinibacter sediminicola]
MSHNSVTYSRVTLVALGANLPGAWGPPADAVRAAFRRLDDSRLHVIRASRLFLTPCVPAGAGPDYVNAAAALTGDLSPTETLAELHRIENEFGRARVQRWGSRTLDIDLLAIGDTVLPDPTTQAHWRHLTPEAQQRATPDRLILPHPRLQDRAFVLVPLMDVAPDWTHPLLGRTVREMTADLPEADRMAVTPL